MISGNHILVKNCTALQNSTFQARNPESGQWLDPHFNEADTGIIDCAAHQAASAFDEYRSVDGKRRSELLMAIADELMNGADDICSRAFLETALPRQRLEGELLRTANQLRMFAEFVANGLERETLVEEAEPERVPLPRPELRLSHIPLGPVVVFGASNFPLAFSVAGGDTAAALAAGCPVIVKGHPAHPGTSELAGQAIVRAIGRSGLPRGIFSLIQGQGADVGQALVSHPLIRAVAFTGSQQVGRFLFDLANQRPEPIPLFAEMGSVNPQFVLPRLLSDSSESFARDYAASLTLGAGQFCTNPGLLIIVKDEYSSHLIDSLRRNLEASSAQIMTHRGIKANFIKRIAELTQTGDADVLVDANRSDDFDCRVTPVLLETTAEAFLNDKSLGREIFGPACVVVTCDDAEQLKNIAIQLEGQLSASVHADPRENDLARELFHILETKAGRLLYNGFPTGVEVSPAMQHGGPYPASTDSRFTSVGMRSIRRFLRPVCYQNFTSELLPDGLRR